MPSGIKVVSAVDDFIHAKRWVGEDSTIQTSIEKSS